MGGVGVGVGVGLLGMLGVGVGFLRGLGVGVGVFCPTPTPEGQFFKDSLISKQIQKFQINHQQNFQDPKVLTKIPRSLKKIPRSLKKFQVLATLVSSKNVNKTRQRLYLQ